MYAFRMDSCLDLWCYICVSTIIIIILAAYSLANYGDRMNECSRKLNEDTKAQRRDGYFFTLVVCPVGRMVPSHTKTPSSSQCTSL